MTEIDIPGLAGQVRTIEDRIRNHFRATDVDADTSDEGVTLRLEFRGFDGLDPALERIGEVAREFEAIEAEDIHAGVNTSGGYDPQTDETDDRPMGWVNATFTDTGGVWYRFIATDNLTSEHDGLQARVTLSNSGNGLGFDTIVGSYEDDGDHFYVGGQQLSKDAYDLISLENPNPDSDAYTLTKAEADQ